MPTEVSSYVELSALFPGRECTLPYLAECLGALPLDLVLTMCARANQVASGPGPLSRIERQQKLANSLLPTEVGKRLNEVVRTRCGGNPARITLFFRAQLLELTRWALLFCSNEQWPVERPWTQTEKDLFVQAALICSRITESKVLAVLGGNTSGPALKDIRLVFFRSALDAALIGPDPCRVVGRAQQLFLEYLPKYYRDLDSDFKRAAGASLLEYMTAAGALVAMHLQLDSSMILADAISLGSDTEYAEVYQAYQRRQVWDADSLRETFWPGKTVPQSFDEVPAFNIKPLREKPIIALGDGRGAIPDPILLADSVLIGPAFQLAQVKEPNYVFGCLGDAFEEYACDILGRMFPYRRGLHQILHRKVPAVDEQRHTFEIDACLDYIETLVLIEAKAVFMSDPPVTACDEAAFRAELERKYLRGERDVGIAQLARAMRSIAAGTWTGLGRPGAVKLVYPVLVVHDRLLVEPSVTEALAEMLVSELGATPVPASWQWRIDGLGCPLRFAPLTMLTIGDLEDLEESVGNVAFLSLLQAYSAAVPNRRGSLQDFVASSEFRNAMRMNRTLAVAGQSFIREAARRIFGRDVGARIE